MRFFLPLFLLSLLAAPLYAGDAETRMRTEEEDAARYAKIFAGHTRDEIVSYYGAPSHTIKLDAGARILEYNVQMAYVHYSHHRENLYCAIRFWLDDAHKVFKVTEINSGEALLDGIACRHFIKTRERKSIYDRNDESSFKFRPR